MQNQIVNVVVVGMLTLAVMGERRKAELDVAVDENGDAQRDENSPQKSANTDRQYEATTFRKMRRLGDIK